MRSYPPVVYVAIMADDALPSNNVVELDDVCVASEEYFMDADISVIHVAGLYPTLAPTGDCI